jgi:hypothetical protein
MSFLRTIAEVIVRRAGYQVPVDTSKLAKNSKPGLFSSLINRTTGMPQMPAPPTPPADPADVEKQREYNEALLAYNQQFQTYNTQIMQMFMQRFSMMQQTLLMTQRQQQQQQQAVNSSPSISGVGGILGGDTDI